MGERIRFLRTEMGLSQEELAELVGFKTRSAINKIELNQRDLKHSQIITFARALNSSPHYLLEWSDIPHPEAQALNTNEQQLVASFRKLNSDGQTAALAAVNGFAMLEQYVIKKCDDISEIS